jgi:hypothetical protein
MRWDSCLCRLPISRVIENYGLRMRRLALARIAVGKSSSHHQSKQVLRMCPRSAFRSAPLAQETRHSLGQGTPENDQHPPLHPIPRTRHLAQLDHLLHPRRRCRPSAVGATEVSPARKRGEQVARERLPFAAPFPRAFLLGCAAPRSPSGSKRSCQQESLAVAPCLRSTNNRARPELPIFDRRVVSVRCK